MSTSSSSLSLFSGNSRYASDFQAVIDRATAIASLPITQLNNEKTALGDQSTALTALNGKFAGLQSAVDSIGDALGSGAFAASVSDESVTSATLGAGALEGTYSIEVTSLGAFSTSISSDPAAIGAAVAKVTDPNKTSLTTASSFSLTVGTGAAITITPATKTLTSLASAINASGAAVRATLVNVGSSTDPDYRLSLQSTKLGPVAIALQDGTTGLLTSQTTGSLATYKVNGVSKEATSDSRTVAIAPGLTLELLAKSATGVATNITITRQSSALSSALAGFATAYNATVDELDKHRGDANGALSGQEVVYSLGESLRSLASYGADSGGISSLESLGLTFDRTGRLNFDQFAFMAADFTSGADMSTFLGSATGGGFLKAADDVLNSATDPLSGRLTTEMASVNASIDNTDTLIADNQARVSDLTVRLQEQMAAADAAIASMEQQYNYMSSLFESMRVASQSYGG